MKLISCCLLGCLITISTFAQNAESLKYTIAPWFNNKKAAVTLTFDDGIPGQYHIALPLLNQYGFKSTFFVAVKIINDQKISWDLLNQASLAGHEIANHALTHPHFIKIPLDTIAFESIESNKYIDKYIPGKKVITHAYPFGEGGGNTEKDKGIRQTVSKYFIGARATKNKPYAYNKYDFALTNDDYYNINSQMITDSASMADFGKNIDETIAIGGWFCPTYHGIADGWIITPGDVFEKHLIELDKRKADLWIAPFKNVIQYHKERNSATLRLIRRTPKTWQLSLSDTLTNRNNFDQPLTINLTVNKLEVKSILQKGKILNFNTEADKVIFNALPGPDKILVNFK
ncbi:polysaccharide deacetylase family protein [Mucilaginibacter sp.]|jgi:peptidoglycan/xylan/chitin deacetylase (PgdA/CDA1 family)|uniref:polysaccharide deacetylase family protein n=1 Tax=Mucilaginibacter sp. TaxID=1882438 RepID=UPI003566F446